MMFQIYAKAFGHIMCFNIFFLTKFFVTCLTAQFLCQILAFFFFRSSHPLMGDDNERICIAISFHVMYLWQLCTKERFSQFISVWLNNKKPFPT